MNVFIVEDEIHIRQTMVKMLRDLDITCCGSAASIEEAKEGLLIHQPDVVLMDVELGNQTSFDLLRSFDKVPFRIIFITAHNKYAVEAFRFSAVDFLLKPVQLSELDQALDRAKTQLDKDTWKLQVENLLSNQQSAPNQQKLVLKTHDNIHLIKLEDIIHCCSDMSYTEFYLTGGERILVSKTLLYYQELLEGKGFFRVHKSHLINLNHIVRIHKADGGEVEMTGGDRISISQRKREEFLSLVDRLGLV